VIFSFIPVCGHCHFCSRGTPVMCERGPSPAGLPLSGSYQARLPSGEEVGQMQRLGAFSERTVVHEDSCAVIPLDVSMAAASLLSCGFTTGAGAVLDAASTRPGDSVVVIGAGGVGHAAIIGAVVAGAATIIAVDVQPHKLQSALRFGATAIVDASDGDWVAAVRELTGGYGADRAISSLTQSTPEHLRELVAAVSKGGTAVMVGSVTGLDSIDVAPRGLVWEAKTLVGTLFGTHDPQRAQTRFIDLYRAGRLPLDDLITSTYGLDEVNVALADLAVGKNIRGVILM
jgi:Zn-dependent alcohol dehydrogenase